MHISDKAEQLASAEVTAPRSHLTTGLLTEGKTGHIPKSATCEKHGEFEIKLSEALMGRVFVMSTCPSCSKDHYAEHTAAAERHQIIINAEHRLDRLRCAGVSERALRSTFETYNARTKEQQAALRVFKGFADLVCSDGNAYNVIATGSLGVGKTHLASAVVNQCVGKCEVKMIKVVNMVRSIKSTYSRESDETEQDVIDYYSSVPVLVLDEVGVQFGSDAEKLLVFDVIDGRYENMLPTILISNLDLNGVKSVMGERVVDRLREDGGKLVGMEWDSYRGQK